MKDLVATALVIVVTSAVIFYLIFLTAQNFYNRVYLPYKKELVELDFDSALSILRIIINTELDAYENDIFVNKGSITNSNFDNYYKDITNKIVNNLSPALIKHLSLYITEDMIYVIIARAVKKFLTEKINGTL